MSYLYGIRYKMEENDLILALREVSSSQEVTNWRTTDGFY